MVDLRPMSTFVLVKSIYRDLHCVRRKGDYTSSLVSFKPVDQLDCFVLRKRPLEIVPRQAQEDVSGVCICFGIIGSSRHR
jgi:hypothetical protein